MPINTQALRTAIIEGAKNYLREVECSDNFFASHGVSGRTTAEKIIDALENKEIAENPLRILTVAQAIFFSSGQRPTLKNYIYRAMQSKFELAHFLITNSGYHEYGRIKGYELYEKIDEEIQRISNSEPEDLTFKAKRSAYLHQKQYGNAFAFFNLQKNVPKNAKVEVIIENVSCTIL